MIMSCLLLLHPVPSGHIRTDRGHNESAASPGSPGRGSNLQVTGDFGVVWAVTGGAGFWKEVTRSARSLKIQAPNATVFTRLEELETCGRASDVETEAGWNCKVASVAASVVLEKAEREGRAQCVDLLQRAGAK